MTDTHPEEITDRIAKRSAPDRSAYLGVLSRRVEEGPSRGTLACGKLAHAVAVGAAPGKRCNIDGKGVHIAIVTAYNDMLFAHQPYGRVPDLLKAEIRAGGGTAQVVGGAPAMCDGVTQGRAVLDMDWAFLPGIAIVSEAMTALDAGFRALKFFSAEASGGKAFLKSVGAVLPDLTFCPTGGITVANADDYLAMDNIFAVGGSWLQK